MSDEIIKVLDHISDKFGIAIDWSSANVIPYLQDLMTRMVKYVTYTESINIIFYILMIAIFIFIIFYMYKCNKDDIEGFIMLSIAPLILIIVLTFFTLSSVNNIIEVNTIPEKYLIEMIQSNISNNNN